MKTLLPIALAATVLALGSAALAQTSTYTPIDLETCTERAVKQTDELPLALWDCPGHADITVLLSESDGRFGIAYGLGQPRELGDSNTLPAFNRLGDMLEWRLDASAQRRSRPSSGTSRSGPTAGRRRTRC